MFQPNEMSFLVDLIRRRSGIRLGPENTYLLETRLRPLLAEEGLEAPSELVRRLQADEGSPLTARVIERITTHETSFFRDPEAYEVLAAQVLPELCREAGTGGVVRVWSAACATGQEPYSLSMLAEELGGTPGGARVKILATDISGLALAHAREGIYSQLEVTRGLTDRRLDRHFAREGRHWRVRPEVRARIRWGRQNLVSEPPPPGRFDLVLCRNVLIYFEPATRSAVLGKLHRSLATRGYLLVGASEGLSAAEAKFTSAACACPSWFFRRADASAPGRAA